MIHKDKLSASAAKATMAIIDSLPAPGECSHEFTPRFQKKMQRTIRRAKHPIIYNIPKRVACFIIAAIIIGSTWLTVDADARTEIFAWIREKYEEFIEYRFVGKPSSEKEKTDYELTWLPDGYTEIDRLITEDGCTIIYSHDVSLIQFVYSTGADADSLFVGDFNGEVQTIQIGEFIADFYQAQNNSQSSTVVWMSAQKDTLFSITTSLPKDIIIELCKSVQKVSYNFKTACPK